ncbi:helix-turn-helix domain-containing protein [Sphingobacterium pedocola]|uniref:AraC family transcriptional regulator n=1 Tax=Sphingobacterium pedocola TaxID=2082722 RepID=A0ABR9T1G5_9SPHI|nr:helix-turn-helix domain-containing protein [Sphingobacterium pedocola]MBE8719186.1 AraC family transcriptional regulator [Sphingobacterium pedocola]
MEAVESILQYYQNTNKEIPTDILLPKRETSHFNILESMNCLLTFPYMRRDYYKICLVDNSLVYQMGDRKIEIDGPCIVFSNPTLAYSLERKYECNRRKGYICLFNEDYLTGDLKAVLLKLNALYQDNVFPYIKLTNEEYEMFSLYFRGLRDEYTGSFEYRKEIIVNLLRLIIYLAIKIQLQHCPELKQQDFGDRLVRAFMKLLDGQFPVDSPKHSIHFKTPAEFADKLNVHVNHLNHSLKTGTGKSTTHLIQERIVTEAMDLLKNTDWSIGEIGNSLGFEYPQHFSYFLKKQTGQNPSFYKKGTILNIFSVNKLSNIEER